MYLIQQFVLGAQDRAGEAGAGAEVTGGAGRVTEGGGVGGFNASVGNCCGSCGGRGWNGSCGTWAMTGGAPNWANATPDNAVAAITARRTLVPNIYFPLLKTSSP